MHGLVVRICYWIMHDVVVKNCYWIMHGFVVNNCHRITPDFVFILASGVLEFKSFSVPLVAIELSLVHTGEYIECMYSPGPYKYYG